jgi:hypothetical protein
MSTLPKWRSIVCFVRAANAGDAAVASLARHYAREWNRLYNRSHAAPSAREIHDLTAVLAESGPALDDGVAAEIEFAIRSFS